MRSLPFLFGLPLLFGLSSAAAGTLEVAVDNVRNDAGTLLIAVCDAPSFLTAECPYYGRVPAGAQPAELVFDDVALGRYAVQVIHDENANDAFDRNVLGLPKEGYGFSNNPRSPFGPPDFEAAAISIENTGTRTEVALRYLFD
jgi:uncharacterized protein (DUF2141 family)